MVCNQMVCAYGEVIIELSGLSVSSVCHTATFEEVRLQDHPACLEDAEPLGFSK